MLDLLRFQPERGRDRYLDYLRMAGPMVARYGADITLRDLAKPEPCPVVISSKAPSAGGFAS
jgi:hypothetical protein